MRVFVAGLCFLVAGCSCSLNSDEAKRIQTVEFRDSYYTYYTQAMWDAELWFVIKTTQRPPTYLKSPNGNLSTPNGLIVHAGTRHDNWPPEMFLRIEADVLKICDVAECETISM